MKEIIIRLEMLEDRFKKIKAAIEAQAIDEALWLNHRTIGEAYVAQSLRWLHAVCEYGDEEALLSIVNQSNGDTISLGDNGETEQV